MLSRQRARSLIRGGVWALTLGGALAWLMSMGMSLSIKLFAIDGRLYTIESAAGAVFLNNLDSPGSAAAAAPVGSAGRFQVSSMRLIGWDQIRWYPRLRTYSGIGFTLALPYWLPAVGLAALYVFVPWLRPRANCCVECGYSLAGLPGDRCPECGTVSPPRRA